MDYDELLKNFESDDARKPSPKSAAPQKPVAPKKQAAPQKSAPQSSHFRNPDGSERGKNSRIDGDETAAAAKSAKAEQDKALSAELARAERERRQRVSEFHFDRVEHVNPTDTGVYFANNPGEIKRATARKDAARKEPAGKDDPRDRRTSAVKPTDGIGSGQAAKKSDLRVTVPPATARQKREMERKRRIKEAKKKWNEASPRAARRRARFKRFAVCLLIVAVVSTILCWYGLNCINDILSIKAKDKAVEVTVSSGQTDEEVIDLLHKNKLIHNPLFCKLFVNLVHVEDEENYQYVTGSYTLTPSMGLEKMLSTMQADYTQSETVSVTFPEGYTVDQIAEKLEKNKVCDAAGFITALQTIDFSGDYPFLAKMQNRELRFRVMEGYLYPDTYDFYVGETASSVVRKFLDNFNEKWTKEYTDLAEKKGMTLDEVITLASILQKEAANKDEMKVLSGIISNRLAEPSEFPYLQSDATENYLLDTIKPTLTSSTEDTNKYISFRNHYDTYSKECVGLPVGPICNPGDNAIHAALAPEETDYYYFRHDKNGKVYYAVTLEEHEQNAKLISKVDGDDEDE